MTPDYYVRYLPFPARVGAVVIPNDDGSFDIYISSRLSDAAQRQRLEHELIHIREDHFYRSIPVMQAEAEANGLAVPPSRSVPSPVTVAPAAPEDDWLRSWRQAMDWAEAQMRCQGWSREAVQK